MANLRHFAHADATTPSQLGWFVERRMQQYLSACAGSDHIDRVSTGIFDFQFVRQQLEDGVFLFPLCAYLKAKLGGGNASAMAGGGNVGQGRSFPNDSVTNPQARTVKLTNRDVWQVLLDHARDAPLPNMCCRFHLNGRCVESCNYRNTHVALNPEQLAALPGWVTKCHSRMRGPADEDDRTHQERNRN